jgi:hypothetical protein
MTTKIINTKNAVEFISVNRAYRYTWENADREAIVLCTDCKGRDAESFSGIDLMSGAYSDTWKIKYFEPFFGKIEIDFAE